MSARKGFKFHSRKRSKSLSSEESSVVRCFIPPDVDKKVADLIGIIQHKACVIRPKPPVKLQPYLENGIITVIEYEILEELQRTSSKTDRDALLEKYQGDVFRAILKALLKIYNLDDMQKLMVTLDDMLWEDLTRIEIFYTEIPDAWKSFMELMQFEDEFIQHLSSRIIIKLLRGRESCPKPSVEEMWFFLSWLKEEIKVENEYLQSVARCLQELLQVDMYRKAFMKLNGIVKIIRLLSVRVTPQMQYQFGFCIWVTSFNPFLAEKLTGLGIVPIMIDILQSCPTEISKLPRVILATFRNFLEKPKDPNVRRHNGLLMLQCRLLKHLDVLQTGMESSSDPEYHNDFEYVQSTLQSYVAEMSGFDEYLQEVASGRLEWSIVHTSKRFWVENAARLNEGKYQLLKILLDLMQSAGETLVLCIATHDVGEYMRHCPRGKLAVEQLGGKQTLLKLLEHRHPAVKYHALKSLQILMLNNYDVMDTFHNCDCEGCELLDPDNDIKGLK